MPLNALARVSGPAHTAILPSIVEQHAQEAVALRLRRSDVVHGSRARLSHLAGLDARLSAHLDGLSIADEEAWPFCESELERVSRGSVFTAAVLAIEQRRSDRIGRLLAIAGAVPDGRRGIVSALGWLGRDRLKGIVAQMLDSRHAAVRLLGIAACAVQRVNPGDLLVRHLQDADGEVRARALRTAGEVGARSMLAATLDALADEDPACRIWAHWSAVLLGERGRSREALLEAGLGASAWSGAAFPLGLQASDPADAHAALRRLAAQPNQLARVITGCGIVGDPAYVPWLIQHMGNDRHARRAGEAFTLITGADLEAAHLQRPQPEGFQSGPNDDPSDPVVETDPDDGLPWPDADHVHRWWIEQSGRFTKGTRTFMGAPVTRPHCVDVLRRGGQRQRILAAHYLCLLDAGTPLFNLSAPAWRQARLLSQM